MRPSGRVEQCPCATEGEQCETYRNGFRVRKTGSCFPIQIMRCLVHGHFFTVYPMGFDPYGRMRLVPVDVAGSMLDPGEEDAAAPGAGPICDRRWQGTIFRSGGLGRRSRDSTVAARDNRRRPGDLAVEDPTALGTARRKDVGASHRSARANSRDRRPNPPGSRHSASGGSACLGQRKRHPSTVTRGREHTGADHDGRTGAGSPTWRRHPHRRHSTGIHLEPGHPPAVVPS